jgi:hypothetical protein
LFVFPLLVVLVGLAVERGGLLPELRGAVQARSIPTGMLRQGETAKLARLFEHKTRRGVELAGIDAGLEPAAMPSTLVLPAGATERPRPLLSLAVDEDDLYDPQTGILARPFKRGKKWERPGYVSFFDDGGALRFGSAVGVRVHGGKSRGHEYKSFRLYFRDLYGAEQFGGGLLFGSAADPIRSLVVHNDRRTLGRDPERPVWRFMNPLAFDIVRRVGGLAPPTEPVELYLNGESQGPYVLMEHLDENGLRVLLGADSLTFGRTRLDADPEPFRAGDRAAFDEFWDWPLEAQAPLTIEAARRRVDLDNLVAWFIAVLYCGTTDPFQGPVVLAGTGPEARWRWVSWDMDQSFMDYYDRVEQAWRIDTFDEVLVRGRVRDKRRAVLLDRLREESPEFTALFVRVVEERLNHDLTPEFLDARVAHYAELATLLGAEDLRFVDDLQRFVEGRHAALRDQLPRYFDSGPARRVRVDADRALVVDGRLVDPPYQGWYFETQPPRIETRAEDRAALRFWLVDGRRVERLDEEQLGTARVVEAVFGDADD